MNVRERQAQRIANLAGRPQSGWYRVIRNDAAGPTRVDIYDEIGGHWLFGGVSAADFVAELAEITGDLEVHINSPGGDVFDGLAIYNAIAQRSGNVTTVVDGLAASAASFIAQAGRTRMVSPGSMMMIHDASGVCIGNAGDMRELADLLDKVSGNIASLYAERGGLSAPEYRDAMRAETWYTADEAVQAGLADKLAERPAEPDALAAAAAFDLSIYARVPGRLKNAAEKSCADLGHQCCKDAAQDLDARVAAAVDRQLHVANGGADESSWDGPAAMSRAAKSDDPEAAFRAICAGEKTTGDPDQEQHWALPHHANRGDPPNRKGVSSALGYLDRTQDLKDKSAARAHLKAHQATMGDGDADDHADPGFDVDPAELLKALKEGFQ